jgi:hypothetical protein
MSLFRHLAGTRPFVTATAVGFVGEDRDDDELDELVLADERVGCVVVSLALCDSAAAERAAVVPQAW